MCCLYQPPLQRIRCHQVPVPAAQVHLQKVYNTLELLCARIFLQSLKLATPCCRNLANNPHHLLRPKSVDTSTVILGDCLKRVKWQLKTIALVVLAPVTVEWEMYIIIPYRMKLFDVSWIICLVANTHLIFIATELDPNCGRNQYDNPDNLRGHAPSPQGYMPLLIPQLNPSEDYCNMKKITPQESQDDPSVNYMVLTFNSDGLKCELVNI